MADLSGVKVGDEIAVSMGVCGRVQIRRVAAVFKQYLRDDSGAKWSFDGTERPMRAWSTGYASHATDALRETALLQRQMDRCVALLRRLGERLSSNKVPGNKEELARKILEALDGIEADDAA
jgi:hypothetical protein